MTFNSTNSLRLAGVPKGLPFLQNYVPGHLGHRFRRVQRLSFLCCLIVDESRIRFVTVAKVGLNLKGKA